MLFRSLFRRAAWAKVWAHLKEYARWCTDVDPRHFRQQFFRDLVRSHIPAALIPWVRRLKAKLVRSPQARSWYTESFQERACRCASRQAVASRPFATVRARSLYQESRSGYHVLCMEWNNKVGAMHGLEMAFPFLDRDLISFLMAIPGEMQTWNGVHKSLLREAMRGVLPTPIINRRWKADFTDFVNEGMAREYPRLIECLQSGGMAVKFGYVRENELWEALTQLRERIHGPNALVSWSLSDLLGLELWLQVFFGEDPMKPSAITRMSEERAIFRGNTTEGRVSEHEDAHSGRCGKGYDEIHGRMPRKEAVSFPAPRRLWGPRPSYDGKGRGHE